MRTKISRNIKAGDLVRVDGYKRLWVAINVTQKDIAKGMNADRPGIYLFSGYWYQGRHGGALSHERYGKITAAVGMVVGRMRGHFIASRFCM